MNTRGKQYRTAVLIIVGVLTFFGALGGAAALWWHNQFAAALPEPPKDLPSAWPSQYAEQVRRVPMPTGEMVAALPKPTAGHVLCGAVPEQTWAKILGGPVLREATTTGTCHVVTATLDVQAELTGKAATSSMFGSPREMSVGERSGTVFGDQGGTGAELSVRLITAPDQDWITPFLFLHARQNPYDRTRRDLPGLLQSLGEDIINAVTAAGLPLPKAEPDQTLPVRSVGPIAGSGIVDAAFPMIAWQLCTLLAQSAQRPIEEFVPKADGSCHYRKDENFGVQADYRDFPSSNGFSGRLGGRPALVEPPRVEIKLSDDSPQWVRLAWLSPRKPEAELREWAGKLVPPLLGQ